MVYKVRLISINAKTKILKNPVFIVVFCVCKFRIYSTVFTPHIYFIIPISMIAGNLVEIIRFPQTQNRKCLRKFNFSEIRSPGLSAYRFRALVSTQGFLSFHDV
jgi:hypothetical protein